eukprot:364959-Chlamydomonas_euryale.AAC.11
MGVKASNGCGSFQWVWKLPMGVEASNGCGSVQWVWKRRLGCGSTQWAVEAFAPDRMLLLRGVGDKWRCERSGGGGASAHPAGFAPFRCPFPH